MIILQKYNKYNKYKININIKYDDYRLYKKYHRLSCIITTISSPQWPLRWQSKIPSRIMSTNPLVPPVTDKISYTSLCFCHKHSKQVLLDCICFRSEILEILIWQKCEWPLLLHTLTQNLPIAMTTGLLLSFDQCFSPSISVLWTSSVTQQTLYEGHFAGITSHHGLWGVCRFSLQTVQLNECLLYSGLISVNQWKRAAAVFGWRGNMTENLLCLTYNILKVTLRVHIMDNHVRFWTISEIWCYSTFESFELPIPNFIKSCRQKWWTFILVQVLPICPGQARFWVVWCV